MIWWLPGLLQQHFGVRRADLYAACLPPLACGVPYAAVLWWLARIHEPRGWLGLGAETAGTAGLALALWWFLLLSVAEQEKWRSRIRQLLLRQPAV